MIIIGWIILSFVVAWFGDDRQIGFGWALIISLVFSPLIGAIVVFLSERKSDISYKESMEASVRNQERIIHNLSSRPAGPSKADEIKELKKLLDEGTITQEDFERGKRSILLRVK